VAQLWTTLDKKEAALLEEKDARNRAEAKAAEAHEAAKRAEAKATGEREARRSAEAEAAEARASQAAEARARKSAERKVWAPGATGFSWRLVLCSSGILNASRKRLNLRTAEL
jgi:hypothetical protein